MIVKNPNSSQLSNFEVLEFLKEPVPHHILLQLQYQEYRTCIHSCKEFLMDPMMPCSVQSKDQLVTCLSLLQPFQLTRMEELMLINTRPLNRVELMVVVEDISSRLGIEKQEELLAVLDQCLVYARPVESE
jgi:hypothetical protein